LDRGWSVVIDARDSLALRRAEKDLRPRLGDGAELVAVSGDVTDEAHRRALLLEVGRLGSLDLLVNNASTLGATPLPSLSSYPLEALRRAYEVNVVAPLALVQAALSQLLRSSDPRILNVSSDASVEAYEGWGGYGSSKAALDHLSAIWAVEQPWCRAWSVDPGDLRTQLHQEAFPGEDISDRPEPATVIPALLTLIGSSRSSGRVRAADIVPTILVGDPS